MMLKKNEDILREIEGLSEEQSLQWFMDRDGGSRNDAIQALAVARGEESWSDIWVTDESGNRLTNYGLRQDGTLGELEAKDE